MFEVDIRELRRGPIDTVGQLEPEDRAFSGLDLGLERPLAVRGRLQAAADGEYYWQATLEGAVRGTCRRCLADRVFPVRTEIRVMFSSDPDAADDPSVYPVEAQGRQVDLRPAIREEIALAIPSYWVCRDDCAGLCPRCGADLNAGPCPCTASPNPT